MTKRSKLTKNKMMMKQSDTPKVDCCMCGQKKATYTTLIPRKCLNKSGVSSHRICQQCWWNPKTGFALEGVKHDCPGCVKGLPLNTNQNPDEIIDLTEDYS
jgi:hypothetical protein